MPDDSVCREQILSEEYRDFITRQGRSEILGSLNTEGACQQSAAYDYRVLYLEAAQADPITLTRFGYQTIPKCYTLIDKVALSSAGITQIQNYPGLQLKGNGVIIGIVDTGIDYTNPVFSDALGKSRIIGIWDQTIQTGTPPSGFLYGSEYTKEMIQEALDADRPRELVPTTDENGHGTFLAGIAAGKENAPEEFLGAAPEALIAVVKLKEAKRYLRAYYKINPSAICYQENDILLGLQYLNLLAQREDKPIVLCVALGSNMGGHDGASSLSNSLEFYARSANRIVVIGGGNEAVQQHHYLGSLSEQTEEQEVEIRVSPGNTGFTAELWTDIPNIFAISLLSPSGERVPRLPIRTGTSQEFTFILDRTRVYVDYRLLVENTNSQLIFFRFDTPTAGIWKIIVEPVQLADGVFHIWLPVTEFLTGEVIFLQSNPDFTITTPGNALAPMTVSYYDDRTEAISIHSGRGFTRLGIKKPDFAAPGVNVIGPGPNNTFVSTSGSSVAVGITAGAAALMTEWILYDRKAPLIDSVQIKNLLILGTERREGESYPNRLWGYGQLNLLNTFQVVRNY
ncbi:MAG: S8 family peptidase [Lachnospiraceae bacterium]|nr:S8 family peptidase [Lachnospiraceae bacterium]